MGLAGFIISDRTGGLYGHPLVVTTVHNQQSAVQYDVTCVCDKEVDASLSWTAALTLLAAPLAATARFISLAENSPPSHPNSIGV